MENEKNISIDKVVSKPNLFEFELIKEIIYQRNVPLSRIEREQLLKIVKNKYSKKLEEYDDEIKSMFLVEDFWGFLADLNNWHRWGFVPIKTNELNDIDKSLSDFFNYSSKLISKLIANRKQNDSEIKFPISHIDKLSPNEIAILFLTMQKRKLIHSQISKKDLAVLLHALTGYKSGHFTGRLSKVNQEIEIDDTILRNVINELSGLLSDFKRQLENK